MRSVAIFAASAALLAPLGAFASPDGSASVAQDMTPTAAMPYVQMAGASDLYEIQSSRLALEKSQNSDVRALAQMLITHHTQTTQQVTAAATAAGLTPPPPMLMAKQAAMIAELQPLSGDAFDRTYLRQQKQAHQMALALHQTYARQGDQPSLRTAASSAVPIIQQHIDRLRTIR